MISVIIPSYNRASTIERSVRSVINQTYKDIEIIIVDDCSTDNTKEVVENIQDDRIRYIKNEKNVGACVSRNIGINYAQGEYIAFQDSDDSWRENKLEHQLKIMNKYNADVCFCKFEKHGYSDIDGEVAPSGIEEGIIEYDNLIRYSIVGTPTILAKAEVCKKIMFDAELRRLQDYDWVIRTGKKFVFCHDSYILADAYLQNDSITKSVDYYDAISALIKKYEKTIDLYVQAISVLINKQANIRTYNGERVHTMYRQAYKLTGQKEYLIKSWLAFFGLLKIIFKIKGISY